MEITTIFNSGLDPYQRLTTYMKHGGTEEQIQEALQNLIKHLADIDSLKKPERQMLDEVKKEIDKPLLNEIKAEDATEPANGIRLANRSLQPIAFALRPTTRAQYVKGFLLEALTWVGFIFCLAPILLVAHFISGIIGRAALATLVLEVRKLRRHSKRYRMNPGYVLSKDKRAPILYLRDFSDIYENDPEAKNLTTPEETLVKYYKQYGPVIAVGLPEEKIPTLGALKLYFKDENWKAGVKYLMSVGQAVIIHAGTAPGLLWELGIARRFANPEKVYISFHGWPLDDLWMRIKHYRRFRKYAVEILGVDLPKYIVTASSMSFGPNWEPRLEGEVNSLPKT
jgi:hypothetical protein